ncbi:HNH nuclease family protein [bacterium]|nr:HNH nuclease family protein [bacterium]
MKRKPVDPARQAQILAELQRDRARREQSYREQALKLLPHLCASCGREFSGPRLRELTVHHRDHDWKNNPPDGSNWELLCLYCHDHEHEKYKMAGHGGGSVSRDEPSRPGLANPFDALDQLVPPQDEETDNKG